MPDRIDARVSKPEHSQAETKRKSIFHAITESNRVKTLVAFLALLSSSCSKHDTDAGNVPVPAAAGQPPEHLPHATHSGTQEHMHDHPNMTELLSKERSHPFHQDPEKWLSTHEKEVRECFDLSAEPVTEIIVDCMDERVTMQSVTKPGIRNFRVAGSGVLKEGDEWISVLASYVTELEQRQGGKKITVTLRSHSSCGAAGLKFKSPECPDQPACDEKCRDAIRDMAAKLQTKGIHAVYGGDAPMNGLAAHNALGVTVDGSKRMQRSSFNSFIATSPDAKGIVENALLALKISSGDHSYGDLLRGPDAPFYTYLVFENPDDPEETDLIVRGIEAGLKEFRDQGIKIRIIRRAAPQSK